MNLKVCVLIILDHFYVIFLLVKKEKVQKRLNEKEDELSQVKQELSELKHYQDLQIEQENEIKHLESNLEEMKFKHAKTTRDLKSKFLRDKEMFRCVLTLCKTQYLRVITRTCMFWV